MKIENGLDTLVVVYSVAPQKSHKSYLFIPRRLCDWFGFFINLLVYISGGFRLIKIDSETRMHISIDFFSNVSMLSYGRLLLFQEHSLEASLL